MMKFDYYDRKKLCCLLIEFFKEPHIISLRKAIGALNGFLIWQKIPDDLVEKSYRHCYARK